MNKIYRLLWNPRAGTWVPVAESAPGRGKSSRSGRSGRSGQSAATPLLGLIALVGGLLAGPLPHAQAQAQTPPAPTTLPTGGQVVAGQASLQQQGATLTVQQGSARAAIDWQRFDVGQQAQVNFVQPDARSVTLNRVQSGQASQIFGRITSNGQVFLSNPAGVYFSPTASVDVGGLAATTHRISLDDFMAGRVRFDRQGATGSVVNEGQLRAALGGYIALLAPEVRNQGVVVAHMGTVALAAGEAFELQFDANNTLASLRVEPATVKALVENRSAVLAPGGLVILSAQAMDRVQGGVIRNSGQIEASGLQRRGGRIVLEASDRIENTGSLAANAGPDGPAGSVSLKAPEILNSGRMEALGSALADPTAAGAAQAGGTVRLEAGSIVQAPSGLLDVSGATQGGSLQLRASGGVLLQGELRARAGDGTAHGSPQPAAATQGGAIEVTGAQIEARSATLDASGDQGGRVRLDASPAAVATATPSPAPAPVPSPFPTPEPGKVLIAGSTQITTRGRRGAGGETLVLGDDLTLADHSLIDAQGATGGGRVRVGGGWQGGEGLYQARTVQMDNGAAIDVSATSDGDGGTAVLWSDVHHNGGHTRAQGSVMAQGAGSGAGGRVETSGQTLDISGFSVNTLAPAGRAGLWLIDPYDYTITSGVAATISTALNSSDVTVTTTASNPSWGGSTNPADVGNITFSSGVGIVKTGAATTTLTLQAHRRIMGSNYSISSTGGALNTVLWSNYGNGGFGIHLGTITTRGGHLWVGGGSGSSSWNGLTVGNGPAMANGGSNQNAIDAYGPINTSNGSSGGDVYLWAGTPGAGYSYAHQSGTPAVNAGSGNVTLRGNTLNWTSPFDVTTTGAFTFWSGSGTMTSDTGSFGQATDLSWFRFNASPSAVNWGGSGNTQNVQFSTTYNPTLTVNGPLRIYGGSVTLNAGLNLGGGLRIDANLVSMNNDIVTNGDVVIKTQAHIDQIAGKGITTNGGNLVLWSSASGGNAGYIRTGTISTGGGHVWIGGSLAGAGERTWNGLTVGAGYAGSQDYAGVGLRGNISTNGGDVLIAGESGQSSRGDIEAETAHRTISTGSGDITLMPYSEQLQVVGGSLNMVLQTTGKVSVAPVSGGSFWAPQTRTYNGSLSSGTFTGSSALAGVQVPNLAGIGGLEFGTYSGTGVSGDTAYVEANVKGMRLDAAFTVAGPIRVSGNAIWVAGDLTTTAPGAGVTLRSQGSGTGNDNGFIALLNGTDITTQGGDIIVWANTANRDAGLANNEIALGGNQTLSSSGGKIVLAGGADANADGLPDGYAYRYNNDSGGVTLGQAGPITLNSRVVDGGGNVTGGGDIIVRGKGQRTGILAPSLVTVNSGLGTVSIEGVSNQQLTGGNYGIGIELQGGARITSANTTASAITVVGDARTSLPAWAEGIYLWNQDSVQISATGAGGGVTVTALGGVNDSESFTIARPTYLLANGGPINLTARRATAGGDLLVTSPLVIGRADGAATTHDVTASSSAVTIDIGAGDYNWANASLVTVDTSGPLTLKHTAEDFNINQVTLAQTLSGLTIGDSAGNTGHVTFTTAQSVAGPITAYGNNINVNANLATTNANTGDVTLNASGGVSGSGSVALATGRTLTVNQVGNSTYSGVISGTDAHLVKAGAGDLGLAGASTYGGATTVNGGVLSLAAADRLPDGTALTVNANGTFSLNGFNETVGSIAGSGLIVNGAVVRDGLVLWLDAGNSASYNGVGTTWYDLSGNGYHGTLVGSPTYNASTSLFSFTSNTQYVQIATLPANFLGSTVTGLTVFTVADFGTAQMWERVVDLGNAPSPANTPSNNIILSRNATSNRLAWEYYNGVGVGASYTSIGSNTAITNSVKGSYAGTADGSNLRIYRDGTLNTTTASAALPNAVVRSSNFIGKSNWQQDDTFRGDIGTLMVYNRALSQAEITKNHQLLFNRATATLTAGGNNTSTTFSGKLENGVGTLNLVKAGTGTLTLSGANSYAGSTTVNGGTLRNGAANVVPDFSPVTVASGATWHLDGFNDTVASVSGSGSITLGSGTLSVGGLDTSFSFGGVVSGTGGLTKTGSGTFTLSGTNTYSGTTTVSAGTLASGAADSLSDASAHSVSASATLNLAGFNDSIGSLAGAGTVSLGSAALTTGGNGDSTTFSGLIGGSGSLTKAGGGTMTLTGNNAYTGTTTVAAGTLAVGNGGSSGTLGTGAVTTNAALQFDRSGSVAFSTLAPHAGGIGGSGSVTATAATSLTVDRPISVAGDVQLTATGASLAINSGVASTGGTLRLAAVTTMTDGTNGWISAPQAAITGGTVAFDHASTAVGTLAGSGLTSLSLRNSTALTVGTVGATTGLGSTGILDISTATGDLTVAANISTNATGTNALVLNAGRGGAAGTASGGNIVLSGSPSLGVGSGGRATLYTGSISGSTGLTTLAGSGSGRFRYGSDETTSNFSAPLGSGLQVIYREQPTVTVGVADQTIVYGSSPTWGFTLGGGSNGDTVAQAFATVPTSVAVGGSTSTAGHAVVGTHSATPSGASGTSQLGYAFAGGYTAGMLTVTPRPLAVSFSGVNRVYDAGTTATVTTSDDRLSGDVLTIQRSASFASKNVASGVAVAVTGVSLSGADAANYSVTATGSTTADITPATLTLAGATTGVSKTYDGTSSLVPTGVSGHGALTGVLGSDTVSLSGAAAFDSKDVARDGGGNVTTRSIVQGSLALAGADAGNYSLAWTNGSGTVQPAPLTVHANDEAKFVTRPDPGFTVSYSGFVAGEQASTPGVIGTTPVVTRPGVGTDEAAGTYTGALVASGTVASNYAITHLPGKFTIVPAGELLLRVANTSATYGAAPAYAITSAQYLDGSDVIQTLPAPSLSGNTYTFDDGAGTQATFALAPHGASLSTAGLTRVGAYQLAAASPSISGPNFSALTVVGALTVNPKPVTAAPTAGASKTYDRTAAMTGLVLGLSTLETGDLVSASGSGSFADKNASLPNAKAYTVNQITLAGADASNYFLWDGSAAVTSLSGNGTINPATLTVSFSGVDKAYDRLASATVTTSDDRIAGDNLSIARSASFADVGGIAGTGKNAGTGKTITVTGVSLSGPDAGNYTVASTGTATADITPKALVVSGITAQDKTYDGLTTATIDASSQLQRAGLISGDDVTVTATGNFASANAGANQTVTLSLSYGGDHANYSITGQASTVASIHRRPVQVSASTGVSKTYDGTVGMSNVSIGLGAVTGVAESGVLGADSAPSALSVSGQGSFSSAQVSRDGSGNVLSDKVYTLSNLQLSGTAAGNYVITGGVTSVSGSNGRIDPAPLTITGNSATGTYTGLLQSVSGFTVSGLQGSDTAASLSGVSASGAARTNAGTAANTVTAGVQTNYTVTTVDGLLTIHKAPATVIANSDTSKVYNGSAQSVSGFTATGLVNGETAAVLTGVTAGATGTNAGTYTSTASGSDGNYTLTFVDGSLVIAKAPITITGSSATGTYSGLPQAVGGFAVAGLQGSDTVASLTGVSASGAARTNAGTAANTVTAGVQANYTVSTVDGLLTIHKAPATVIANSDTSKVYNGSAQSVSGFTATGLVNGETAAVLTGVTAGATGTNAGTYTSTASGSDGNYTLTFVDGSLVIAKAPLTVTGNSATGTYSGLPQSVSGFTVSGLQGSDTVASLTGATASGATRTSAGTAVNAVTAGTQTNYTVTAVDGLLTINKAPATVIANSDTTKVYNGAAQSVSGFSATGLVNGETTAVLTGVTAGATGTNAGSYTSTASGSDGNYTLTFVDGSLVIAKAPITVTGNSATGTYSGLPQAVSGFLVSGLQGSDTVASLTGVSASGAARTNAGTASNTVTAGVQTNYTVTTVDGLLTIHKAPATVIANSDTSKVYNGSAQSVSGFTATGLVNGETAAVLTGVTAGATGTHAGTYTSTASGSDANYTLSFVDGSLVIAKAPITVTPVNQTRVYGQANPTFTQTLSGFVNGESAASAGVTGSAEGSSTAGTTAPVGQRVITGSTGSLAAANYRFEAVNGTLTITPAPLSVVLVGEVAKVYDATSQATLAPANFQLSGWVAGEGATVTQTAGTYADKHAGSGKTVAVDLSAGDFSALAGTVLSNYSLPSAVSGPVGRITPAAISAINGLTATDKVYDGNTSVVLGSGTATFTGMVPGDVLTVATASGQFSDKNVGTDKRVDITGLSLGGADAANYVLTNPRSTATASISRLDTVRWIGGPDGNWLDPANWAGGAIPDLANVRHVVIPPGVTVRFDTQAAVPPAETGPVQIDSLGAAGQLHQSSGTLEVGGGGIRLDGFTQTGGSTRSSGVVTLGSLVQSGGQFDIGVDLRVGPGRFEQGADGRISVGGSVGIDTTDPAGVRLGHLSVDGALSVRSSGGAITQAGGTGLRVGGSTTLAAPGHDIRLDSTSNQLLGVVNATGRHIVLRNAAPGGLLLGVIDASGDFEALASAGDVRQTGEGSITVVGESRLAAPAGEVTLRPDGNRFNGALRVNGALVNHQAPVLAPPPPAAPPPNPQAAPLAAPAAAVPIGSTGPSPTTAPSASSAAPVDGVAPSASAGTASASAATPGTSAGVRVDVVAAAPAAAPRTTAPTGAPGGPPETGAEVRVSVPSELLASGFSFALPAALSQAAPADSTARATLADGGPLPGWLRFDPASRSFVADRVPAGGLPLAVAVELGGQRSRLTITEDATRRP